MTAVETKPKLGNKDGHICSYRHVGIIDNFLRPLVHNPEKLFAPYVKPGMTAMDVGCGGGWASMGLSKLVGDTGRVISADLQPEMLERVRSRATASGVIDRFTLHQCEKDKIGVAAELDFVLTFWMAHETPDEEKFLREIYSLLKPGGYYFLAEPRFHVSKKDFRKVLAFLKEIGFELIDRPTVRFSRTAVFIKGDRGQGSGVSE